MTYDVSTYRRSAAYTPINGPWCEGSAHECSFPLMGTRLASEHADLHYAPAGINQAEYMALQSTLGVQNGNAAIPDAVIVLSVAQIYKDYSRNRYIPPRAVMADLRNHVGAWMGAENLHQLTCDLLALHLTNTSGVQAHRTAQYLTNKITKLHLHCGGFSVCTGLAVRTNSTADPSIFLREALTACRCSQLCSPGTAVMYTEFIQRLVHRTSRMPTEPAAA